MKDWLRDLLLDSKSLNRQYFKRNCVEHLIAEDSRTKLYAKELFSLATLELWQRAFLPQRRTDSGPPASTEILEHSRA